MLRIVNLFKHYRSPDFKEMILALDEVCLEIGKGETLGIVGESGAGKTTLARCILGLEKPTSGEIYFQGSDIKRLKAKGIKKLRKKLQIIWQDPLIYLNPYMRIGNIIKEPLRNYCVQEKSYQQRRMEELLDWVELPCSLVNRYPHELSGGQCQRVAIARALSLDPELLICDEAVSNLDAPTQLQILRLLAKIQTVFNLTYIFISHDIALTTRFCSRMAVMHEGRMVDMGLTSEVLSNPSHPHTRALLSNSLRIRFLGGWSERSERHA